MTRAAKVDGVPTVASRWVLRLKAVLDAAGVSDALMPPQPWTLWARRRDLIETPVRIAAPAPCPPVEARPRQLSVTRIETWIANPYAIFARHVLGLEKLEELAGDVTAALRGTIAHDILNRFTAAHPDRLPSGIESEVMAIANALFRDYGAHPRIWAFWRPQFARFARWFAETEPARRTDIAAAHAEVRGMLDLPGRDFRLTARADRIDARRDGALAIYDYKTGAVPPQNQVADLRAPQLPLEAAIAQAGGFDGIAAGPVAALRYIRGLGRGVAGEDRAAAEAPPEALAGHALARLSALVARFDRADAPYPALRRSAFKDKYRFDEYEHLARVGEWLVAEEAAEDT